MRPFISAFSIYMTVTIKAAIQVGILPFKKIALICFNEVSLKMMKNAFYFMLKTLFVIDNIYMLVLTFWLCRKTAR